jgi:hypothetical protein
MMNSDPFPWTSKLGEPNEFTMLELAKPLSNLQVLNQNYSYGFTQDDHPKDNLIFLCKKKLQGWEPKINCVKV